MGGRNGNMAQIHFRRWQPTIKAWLLRQVLPASLARKSQSAWRSWSCLATGAFLRLWQINALGYNSDEAVYAGQGAAIAADPTLKEIFPVFRAHPLLFQFIVAITYRLFGVDDLCRAALVGCDRVESPSTLSICLESCCMGGRPA